MNARMEDEAREQLLRRRQSLLELYQVNEADERRLHEQAEPDWTDRASQAEASTTLRQLSERERRELMEINAALERIEQRRYGTCEQCSGPIAAKRLAALPFARLCVKCESAADRTLSVR